MTRFRKPRYLCDGSLAAAMFAFFGCSDAGLELGSDRQELEEQRNSDPASDDAMGEELDGADEMNAGEPEAMNSETDELSPEAAQMIMEGEGMQFANPDDTEMTMDPGRPMTLPEDGMPAMMGCGDGVVDSTTMMETCDDQNTASGDGCSSACQVEDGSVCPEPGEPCVASSEVCGDSTVDAGEECDDGNNIDNDRCTNMCTVPVCGDGILQPLGADPDDLSDDEECDDGNAEDDDGCSASCTVEAAF